MYFLIGKKLEHSYSINIHNSFGNNDYQLLSLNFEDLDNFFCEKKFKGLNITIPYKATTLKYVNKLDCVSEQIGVINTVVNNQGDLIGFNTDYYGFIDMIKKHDICFENKIILILGTGATSKTINQVCKDLKAKAIHIVSRNNKNYLSYEEAKKIDANIIINATPYGMYPNFEFESLLDLDNFLSLEVCIDVVYNPLKTPLLIEAKKREIKIVSGLDMLIFQAYHSHQLFFGKCEINLNDVYKELFFKNYNLVLCGMPSSGKSTIGMLLAKKLKLNFIDTDKVIEEKINCSISDFINLFGEEKFRQIEEEVIKEISLLKGYVISLGGGSLIRTSNQINLMRNSILIYLNRSLEFLQNNISYENRPLVKTPKDIETLLSQREETYLKCSDIIINCDGAIDEVISEISKKIK